MTTETSHSYQFKAEIRQLLEILIHSVYSSKDVFLRELISNASDALEKVRFLQVQGSPIHAPDAALEIRMETLGEEGARVLVVSDTGIGMTEAELHENLGTIAHSGATSFLEQLAREAAAGDQRDLNLIGRFGVGFYSVFMVAQKVVVVSRSAQPEARPVMWTSEGVGSYTVETLDDDRPRGTRIEIHLRQEDERFADRYSIEQAVQRYSNFVPFPIYLEGSQINRTSAPWRESPNRLDDEQYNEFFKLISHDGQDPLTRVHVQADAPLQYAALLFVPASNPEALGFGRGEVSLQLYVKRVLIDGENKSLLPNWLRFVRGVVESDDLPLNVSRETLQENRLVAKIRDALARKLLDKLQQLATDKPEDYARFWRTFGPILKEGYNDFAHRERLQELLRFNSSRHDDAEGLLSLADYVAAMPQPQKAIYYLSGPSREALLRDPRLELFRKKNVEVLYLNELADEFVLAGLHKYGDKEFVSADQVQPDDLKALGDDSAPTGDGPQPAPADIGVLVARFKEILGERIVDVRTSERLVDSPACLVTDDKHLSGHMDKVMRLMNKSAELPKRVLELNPRHALVRHLAQLAGSTPDDPFLARACEQIFEGAMLVDGYLADPHKLVERMNQVLEETAALKLGS